jgi:hypothetical protein
MNTINMITEKQDVMKQDQIEKQTRYSPIGFFWLLSFGLGCAGCHWFWLVLVSYP